MQEAKQPAQPPGGSMQQCEHGRVSKREHLADDEMDEEPCDPGAIRVLCDQSAEYQRKVQPGEAGQLRKWPPIRIPPIRTSPRRR